MDLKINKIEISEYGKEICLQNLLLTNKIKENLNKSGDISGVEKIENEVIPVYEKIYFSLDLEELDKIENEDKNALEKIKENLERILKNSGLTKEFILSQLELRKKLSGKSGAEVVKKFYKYKLKEYKKIKFDLLEKINSILDEEEKLNLELSNAIQEEEQMKIIDKLQPVRQKYRELEAQINIYQKEIKICEDAISKKWYYEIYGTLQEKDLLNSFLNIYNI